MPARVGPSRLEEPAAPQIVEKSIDIGLARARAQARTSPRVRRRARRASFHRRAASRACLPTNWSRSTSRTAIRARSLHRRPLARRQRRAGVAEAHSSRILPAGTPTLDPLEEERWGRGETHVFEHPFVRGSANPCIPKGEPRARQLGAPSFSGHGPEVVRDAANRVAQRGSRRQRPERAQPPFEMGFGNSGASRSFEVAGPETQGRGARTTGEERFNRPVGCPPHLRHSPALAEAFYLVGIRLCPEDGDVDQVPQTAERPVSPGMDGHDDGVRRRTERLESLDADLSRNGQTEQFRRRWRFELLDPLRRAM